MTTTDLAPPTTADELTERPKAPNAPVTELVSGIISDATRLVHQEVEMLKAELQVGVDQSMRAAEFGAGAIVCTTVGVISLTTALAFLLHEQLHFAMWASWGIVGGVFLIGGVVMGRSSYILLEHFDPLPNRTINSLKRLFTWKKK